MTGGHIPCSGQWTETNHEMLGPRLWAEPRAVREGFLEEVVSVLRPGC